jgi:hypothetical protein
MTKTIPAEIKWRNSTYVMEKVEEDIVYWFNPVSRHHDHCSLDHWLRNEPYERVMGGS